MNLDVPLCLLRLYVAGDLHQTLQSNKKFLHITWRHLYAKYIKIEQTHRK